MYALLCLLAIASSYLVLRLVERPTASDWALYALTGVAALYTHYYGIFLLAGQALVLLLYRRRGVLACGAMAVGFAPWAPTMYAQTFGHRGLGFFVAPTAIESQVSKQFDVTDVFTRYLAAVQQVTTAVDTMLDASGPAQV